MTFFTIFLSFVYSSRVALSTAVGNFPSCRLILNTSHYSVQIKMFKHVRTKSHSFALNARFASVIDDRQAGAETETVFASLVGTAASLSNSLTRIVGRTEQFSG